MITIATGGRYFADQGFVDNVLNRLHERDSILCIIHGGCEVWNSQEKCWDPSGADWLCDNWALERGILRRVESGAPYFKQYGKQGGRIRNKELALIAFRAQKYYETLGYDNTPISCVAFEGGSGTSHMCKVADNAGFKVYRTWEKDWFDA